MVVDNIKTFAIYLKDENWCRNEFLSVMHTCQEHIITGDLSLADFTKYTEELQGILTFYYHNGYEHALYRLAQTGIFETAMGKVVELSHHKIIYTTEY